MIAKIAAAQRSNSALHAVRLWTGVHLRRAGVSRASRPAAMVEVADGSVELRICDWKGGVSARF